MRKRILVVLLVISAGFNVGVLATFGHHWLFKITPESWRAGRMHRQLGLSNEQAGAMKKDREEMKKVIEPMRSELQKKREELFAALGEDTINNAKIDKLITEIAALQMNLEKTLIDRSINFRKNLTPEQQKKFAQVLKRTSKRKSFMGKMGFEPGPGPDMMREKCDTEDRK